MRAQQSVRMAAPMVVPAIAQPDDLLDTFIAEHSERGTTRLLDPTSCSRCRRVLFDECRCPSSINAMLRPLTNSRYLCWAARTLTRVKLQSTRFPSSVYQPSMHWRRR